MKNNNRNTVVAVIAIIFIAIGLTNFNRIRESIFGTSGITQKGTDVPCINPNLPLLYHIHPKVKIIAYGKNVPLPKNIGLEGACERVLHTHAEDAAGGIIHVESNAVKNYTLADFFSVWGEPFSATRIMGYVARPLDDPAPGVVSVSVDMKPNYEYEKLILKDGQEIVITFDRTQSVP